MSLANSFFKASLFLLAHYSALGVVAVLSYVFGRRLTRRLNYQSLFEQISCSTALGLGLLAYLILLLGALELLYRSALLMALAAGMVWAYPVWRGWPRRMVARAARWWQVARCDRRRVAALTLAVCALALPFCLMPLYPPTAADAVGYHLPVAKTYVQQHALVYTPYLRFPVAPQTNELLFALALLVYDDILAQLLEFLMLLVTAAATAALGRRLYSARAAWWAAAIWLSNPLALWLGAHAYVDMGMALFMTTAVLATLNWRAGRERGWLLLAGVFCGLAVGVKLSALIAPVLLGAVLLNDAVRTRRLGPPLVFGTVALAVAAPWLARSFYYTGNPVFPFLANWFGAGRDTAHAGQGVLGATARYWVNKDWQSFLLLPWNLTFRRRMFYSEVPLSPLYLFTLPLLPTIGLFKTPIKLVAGLAGAYLLYWFFTVQDLRYLVPVLPLVSVATAIALAYSVGRMSGMERRLSYPVITGAGFLILLAPGWLYASYSWTNQRPLPTTATERAAYVTQTYPSYPAYQFLNEQHGDRYKVYTLFNHHMIYYADGLCIAGIFAPGGHRRVLKGKDGVLIDGEQLYSRLKCLGADYFLLEVGPFPTRLPQDDFFQHNFKLQYQTPHFQLFALTTAPVLVNSAELTAQGATSKQSPPIPQINISTGGNDVYKHPDPAPHKTDRCRRLSHQRTRQRTGAAGARQQPAVGGPADGAL